MFGKDLRNSIQSVLAGLFGKHRHLLVAASLVIVPAFQSLHAQELSGIIGTVTDTSGAVAPGATVTAINTATGVASHAVTSAVGAYLITDLIPGQYSIRVEKSGFSTASVQGVTVETGGKKSTVNVSLQPGAVTQTVNVKASQISVELSPEIGTTIEHEMIEELPNEFGTGVSAGLPRGRRLDTYALLAPGVSMSNQSGYRLNGGQDYQNGSSLNGISVPYSNNPGNMDQFDLPFEMVNEARVVTSNTSAQTGMGQGNAAYGFASGTNVLHGSAFEILRNSFLDAPGAYPNGWPGSGPKVTPVDHENNFGFALGGPVILPHLYHGKDKTFFFFNMEWYRYNAPYTQLGTVPTDAMKQGDFSHDFIPCTPGQGGPPCNGEGQQIIPIFVPQAWATNAAAIPAGCNLGAFGLVPGQQFHGPSPTTGQDTLNVIPKACISQITAKSFLPLFPSPNNVGPSNPNPNSNNMFPQDASIPARSQKWGFSVDHSLNQNQKLHLSFWHSPYEIQHNSAPYAVTSPLGSVESQKTTGNGILLNYSNSISNRLVVTAGALGVEGYDDWIALTGVQNGLYPSIIQSPTASPSFSFNNDLNPINGFGIGAPPEQPRHNKGITLTNSWIYTAGHHTVTFGGEFRMTKQFQNIYTYPEGTLNFNAFTTSNNLFNADSNGYSIYNTGSAFASFLLGDVDSAQRNNSGFVKARNFSYSPYLQDDIKLSPKVTVNLGLRWDILVPFTVQAFGAPGEVTYFQPNISNPGAVSTTTGKQLNGAMSKLGTCTGCAGYGRANIHWRNFGPRLGLAYQLNQKTVIRAGYALAYLPGGAYNYGDSGVTNQQAGLLAGFLPTAYGNSGWPGSGLGNWDNNRELFPIPVPPSQSFNPSLCNGISGTSCTFYFSQDPGSYPYSQSWNAGIEREIPWGMLLTATYVANRGVHLASYLHPFNQLNPAILNQLCPGGVTPDYGGQCILGDVWTDSAAQTVLQQHGYGIDPNGLYSPYQNFYNNFGGANTGATVMQALLPFPQFPGIIWNSFENDGASSYNALQTQVQKRMSNGVSLLANYTLSRNMGNAEGGRSYSSAYPPLNSQSPKLEYTVTSFDETHVINISGVYQLPFGPGKSFLNRGGSLMKNLIGGWQASGILNYSSGSPLSISASGNPLNNGFNRANIVPGVKPLIGSWKDVDKCSSYTGGQCTPHQLLNPAAFTDPGPWVPGNSPRNLSYLRLPWYENENASLGKKFFFGERVQAQLRVEYFDVLNRVVKNCSPNTNISSGAGSFGLAPMFCQGNSPRQGQGFFRISF